MSRKCNCDKCGKEGTMYRYLQDLPDGWRSLQISWNTKSTQFSPATKKPFDLCETCGLDLDDKLKIEPNEPVPRSPAEVLWDAMEDFANEAVESAIENR